MGTGEVTQVNYARMMASWGKNTEIKKSKVWVKMRNIENGVLARLDGYDEVLKDWFGKSRLGRSRFMRRLGKWEEKMFKVKQQPRKSEP